MEKFKSEIKALLLKGKTNKEICDLLGCVNGTVSYYRKQLNLLREPKVKPIGKVKQRLISTGFSRELLTRATTKFFRKKQNAKTRGIEFDLTFDDITWNTHCPILGLELDYYSDGIQPNSVSFDRIDNSKGYVPGNVMIISMRANMLKADGTIEEFKKIIDFLNKTT